MFLLTCIIFVMFAAVWIELKLLRSAIDVLTRQREPNPDSVTSVPAWNCRVKVRGKVTTVRVQAESESAAVRELIRLGYREQIEHLERCS